MQVWRGQLSFQVPADSSIQSPAGCSSLRTMLAGSCRQGMCTQEKEDSYQSSFLLPMKQMQLAWAEMSLTGMDGPVSAAGHCGQGRVRGSHLPCPCYDLVLLLPCSLSVPILLPE